MANIKEFQPQSELETTFKDYERRLAKLLERGTPACVACDNPEDPKMLLTLNSSLEWSIQIGDRNSKIGVNPSIHRLLNLYALVTDENYIELAKEKYKNKAMCQHNMSEYLSENQDRLLESLVSDMQVATKALKDKELPPLPRVISILKPFL